MSHSIQIAAMSLTWNWPQGNRFVPWLEEVKEAGYDGITGFANKELEAFIDQPKELKRLLDHNGLMLAGIDVYENQDIDYYKRVSEFLAENNCTNMAYIDPKGKPKEYGRLGEWVSRIGEISLEYGVKTFYHNHTRGIGETLQDVERVYAEVNPETVYMMLDLGHATKDFHELPANERALHFLQKYLDRMQYMEFKDWNEQDDLNIPLGEGECNYPAIFQLIQKQGYKGWITVEQNGNEGESQGRTPLECAKISREFIREGLGL